MKATCRLGGALVFGWGALLALLPLAEAAEGPLYDIRRFGAEPGGKRLVTEAIQAAVERCAGGGGGVVYVPPGDWLSGTIYLDDHVTLWLDNGARLVGSRDVEDYGRPWRPRGAPADSEPVSLRALIAAQDAENIAIRGPGVIDGSGDAFRDKSQPRPRGIYFVRCRDVLVDNVRMRHAGSWMQHYRLCRNVLIRGVRVFNHATYNNDGMNIDSCSEVRVTNCSIDSDDDALVLKSLSDQPCREITIANCVVSSHCNAIKMGTESGGGFQNIAISNCAIRSPQHSEAIYGRQRGLAGLALEIVDGGEMNRVAVSNVTIQGVTAPLFIRLGDRGRPYRGEHPGVGTLQNVVISNVAATDCSDLGCAIAGLPGHPVRSVVLSDVRLHFEGGGARQAADREIPERPDAYPESTMFGQLPAWGLYCRHVDGLTLDNVRLETAQPDLRHAVVLDDAAGAHLAGLAVAGWPGAAPLIRMSGVRGALVRGGRFGPHPETLLQLAGAPSRDIVLAGNDLSQVKRVVGAPSEEAARAVRLLDDDGGEPTPPGTEKAR